MITYDASSEKIVAQDISIKQNTPIIKNNSGGEEEKSDISEDRQTVMSGSGSSQMPFVTKEIYPKIRGVLVVAQGADDIKVQYNIKNAAVAVLGVPYYRVQVLPKAK
jgi:stage III sporulation protein AG